MRFFRRPKPSNALIPTMNARNLTTYENTQPAANASTIGMRHAAEILQDIPYMQEGDSARVLIVTEKTSRFGGTETTETVV